MRRRIERANDFLGLLNRYWNSGGGDEDAYVELVRRSSQVQADLGGFGIADYKPHGASYMITNYQLVVNGISELALWMPKRGTFYTVDPAKDYMTMVMT